MTYIVIPVFNRLHFSIRCIESLLIQTVKDFRIIVVDDGSTDGTKDYIKTNFPEVTLLEGDGNLWWTGSTNLGVKKAIELSESNDDYVLTLNNDLVVDDNYLMNMRVAAKLHPRALIGSVSVDINKPDHVHFAGTKWNPKTAKYRPAIQKSISYSSLKDKYEVLSTDLLPGRGILIPIILFDEIGLYDAETFPHYMADEDFSLRAKKSGYQLLVYANAVVYNHVNETGLNKKRKNLTYYKSVFTSVKSPNNTANRWRWAKRHAAIFPPFYYTMDMARIIKSLIF